jgi:dTDP-4-amino-4,6-dideoxygalactose transaminase
MSKLALLGGKPVRRDPFAPHMTIGEEEKRAALRVLDSGVLSTFYGSNCPEFYGGVEVQAFERDWAAFAGVPHAVAMNSATSGLFAGVGALEITDGDEVIVSPYTMSASAAGILVYRGVPVFADIDPETYCLDPASIERCITARTKAIIVTHLFGHPADMEAIMALARRHGLRVIEDCAQSPGATYDGRFTGTAADIGVFSLNCHKIVQTGEGGVCTTSDPELALRLQLIRNHAEAVIAQGMPVRSLVNMVGFNYRMTEIEAAIGREQLKRLMPLTRERQELAACLSERLARLPGVTPPTVRPRCTHGYYTYMSQLNDAVIGIPRDTVAEALAAEGIPAMAGYMAPLYTQPVYRTDERRQRQYADGTCPVTEAVQARLLGLEIVRAPLTERDMQTIADGFEKVIEHAGDLASFTSRSAV